MTMNHIANGYRSVSLIVDINRDRLIFTGAILAALLFAAFIASL